jgi:hypothetical protein
MNSHIREEIFFLKRLLDAHESVIGFLVARARVARFFLVKFTKTGGVIYQMTTKLPNGRNIFQIARKHNEIFHSEALQNSQIGIFGMKMYIASGNPAQLGENALKFEVRSLFWEHWSGSKKPSSSEGFKRTESVGLLKWFRG